MERAGYLTGVSSGLTAQQEHSLYSPDLRLVKMPDNIALALSYVTRLKQSQKSLHL